LLDCRAICGIQFTVRFGETITIGANSAMLCRDAAAGAGARQREKVNSEFG
jgi:hypothetical protein